MNLNQIAGIAAAVALFIPVLLILAGRLFTNGSLLALFLYHVLAGYYSLVDLNVISLTPPYRHVVAAIINYLDAPLMLLAFLFFCNEGWKRWLVLLALTLIVLYEVIIAFWFGLTVQTNMYLLGPGTLLVLVLAIYFFAYYGKLSIVQGKGLGKTFMLVSIIFSYASFLIPYYLYYMVRTPALKDVFLIYNISVFIASAFMSYGLVCIVKRACALKELQLTRKELALFFDK
jgi:hypothetical protein